MEEELVKITEYEILRDIIDQCIEEDRKITSEEIETDIQLILRDNGIECKTEVKQKWEGRPKQPIYRLIAEVFVYKRDYEKAKKLLENN